METDPPMPAQPPFSEWHPALSPVCSAVPVTRVTETQLHLFHAADVWQTTEAGNSIAEQKACQYVEEE